MSRVEWYYVPGNERRQPEIASYRVAEDLTDFPRGVYLAYANRGLITGLKSRAEAERWRDEGVYDEAQDMYTKCPAREEV